jgi:phenylalanyl-tRNA synthetase beta subunit
VLEYAIRNDVIVKIMKISGKYLKSLDIEKPVIVCEFPNLVQAGLFSLRKKDITFKEYSNFPPVLRDLSVVVDENIKEEEIEKVIFSTKTDNLLKKLKLYDIYSLGENNKKS